MSKRHWLSLALVSLFLSYVVLSPPHTVHHGLHDVDPQECPVYEITTQTNGDLPDILPLPTPLLLTNALPTFDLILPEKFAFLAHRSRAPPVSLPA